MRKYVLLSLAALAASIVSGGGNATAAGMGMHEEKADVSLAAAPNVMTSAKGKASFTLGKDGSTLHYKLHLENAENVTMAHLHAVGEAGGPGPVIVWLYPASGMKPSTKEGKFSGVIAEGDLTPEKFAGDWKGKPVKEVFEQIEYGKAGVAVHTVKNPKTELWGVHKEETEGHMKKEKKKM